VVAGTLKCGADFNGGVTPSICGNDECTLKLGVKAGACSTVFPATTGLAAGQVLSVVAKVEGPSCTGQIIDFSQIRTRYCSGPSFNGSDVECKFGNVVATTLTTTTPAIPAKVDFSPQTLNVSCNNNDVWRLTISSDENLDVALINPLSLKVEGYSGVTCGDVVGNNLTCDVAACQSDPAKNPQQLGRFVAGHRNADGTFDLTVTGSLMSGTAILGEDHVKTSGQ
jgi:hypothetical protein